MAKVERIPWTERTAQTRQALVDAALQLFSENGFDATTTDAVAAEAGVAPRTFFRYFPTKESVLFFGENDFVRAFAAAFKRQPGELTEVEAICQTFVELAPRVELFRDRIKLYQRSVASSTLLRGREEANHDHHAAVISQSIATRRGLSRPTASCQLVADVARLTLQHAVESWAAGPRSASLAGAIRQHFSMLTESFTPSAI